MESQSHPINKVKKEKEQPAVKVKVLAIAFK